MFDLAVAGRPVACSPRCRSSHSSRAGREVGHPERRRRRRRAAVRRRGGRVRRDPCGSARRSCPAPVRGLGRPGAGWGVEVSAAPSGFAPVCDRRRASARPGPDRRPAGRPRRLLRRRRQIAHRAGRRPPRQHGRPHRHRARLPYRRDRSPGKLVGSTPAAWLLGAGRRRGDAAVAEAVRRWFGVRVSRITGSPTAELPDLRPRRADGAGAPAWPIRPDRPFAGAETSEFPGLHGDRGQAGERAAAELRAAG